MIKYTINVCGMMCSMCESHVNESIRNSFVVKKVSSSHKKERTEIIAEQELDKQRLKEVISELGYEVGTITKEEYRKKGLFGRF